MARPPSSAGPEAGPDGLGLTAGRTLPSPGNLWYRQGVVPSYPQGSGWEHVSNNVRRVSVGPLDQVWGQGRGTGAREGRFPPVSPLPSPWCHRRAPGLQPARVPGLGHRQQSPGEPQSEQGNRVSPNRRAAAGAQGSGLGLRHRGEQAGGAAARARAARPRHAPCSGPTGGGLAWGWREARTESLGGPRASSLWKGGLCLLTPSSLSTCPSPSRGAGITSAFGPMPPEPPGVHPRRRRASRASPTGPRWRPGPRRKPRALSAAEASSHLEQACCLVPRIRVRPEPSPPCGSFSAEMRSLGVAQRHQEQPSNVKPCGHFCTCPHSEEGLGWGPLTPPVPPLSFLCLPPFQDRNVGPGTFQEHCPQGSRAHRAASCTPGHWGLAPARETAVGSGPLCPLWDHF